MSQPIHNLSKRQKSLYAKIYSFSKTQCPLNLRRFTCLAVLGRWNMSLQWMLPLEVVFAERYS